VHETLTAVECSVTVILAPYLDAHVLIFRADKVDIRYFWRWCRARLCLRTRHEQAAKVRITWIMWNKPRISLV
jgi:hypothetical protein